MSVGKLLYRMWHVFIAGFLEFGALSAEPIGQGGRALAHPLFGPNGQAILIALPLSCKQPCLWSRGDNLVWSFFGETPGECLLLWLLLATPTCTDSMKTLTPWRRLSIPFVMSRVDYCNTILAGSPRYITDKLQHLLNAAARLITATRKFDHGLSLLLHDELHWLDIPECIHYKLGVTVHQCLHNKAPKYLVDCCTPVSDIASRRHLRSANGHHLTVPRHQLSTFGRRAFSIVGLTSGIHCQTPADSLYYPALSNDCFRQLLKMNLFRRYHWVHTAQ